MRALKILLFLALIFIVLPVYAGNKTKPMSFNFTFAMSANQMPIGRPLDSLFADDWEMGDGMVVDKDLGNIAVKSTVIFRLTQILDFTVEEAGCPVGPTLFIPMRGRVTLTNTDTQSSLLFVLGSELAQPNAGVCVGGTNDVFIGGPYILEGGTGELASYNAGSLVWTILDGDVIPAGTNPFTFLDFSAFIQRINVTGDISVSP
jgi:hypothetical protein